MAHKNSLTSVCKEILTVAGLSVLATVSIPSQAFSITTEIAESDNKTVVAQKSQNHSLTSFLDDKASELLLAKKDDKKDRYRYDDKYDDRKYRKGKHRSYKYHSKNDWKCNFTVGRYINPQRRSLVLYLDILEKPETREAKVYYKVYAKKKNKWKEVYKTKADKLVRRRGQKYYLEPEVIEFKKLKIKEKDLYKTDLMFVTEIKYDYKGKRKEKIELVDYWNYDSITEYRNISEITEVSYTSDYDRKEDRYERREARYERKEDRDDRKEDRYERREYKYKDKKRYSYTTVKQKDWDCVFKLGRVVKADRKAFVIHLDILNKPITKYANVVYQVYAKKNNRWVAVHTSTGARLIKKRGERYYLKPEVIEFEKLRLGNINISQSEIKFVTQIRYDTQTRRDERIRFENTWNYTSIKEVNSERELDIEIEDI